MPDCRLRRTRASLELEAYLGVSGSVCQQLGIQGQHWLAEERRGEEGRKAERRDKIGRNREDEGAAPSPGVPGRLSQSPTQ